MSDVVIPKIPNPYAKMGRSELVNLSVWIDPADHRFLTAIYPFQGRWQNILGTFIKHLVNELKRSNITHWSPESELALIALVNRVAAPDNGSADRERRSTIGDPPTNGRTTDGDDRRPVEIVHGKVPSPSSESADAGSSTGSGRRRKTPKGIHRVKAEGAD